MIRSFLAQLEWRDWVTIASFAFGVVTLIAYYDQRRSARNSSIILKWAALNLDKSISEEQIKDLVTRKGVIEEQIVQHLPALARTAVLREEAHLHEKALAEHFCAWQSIKREQSDNEHSALDPQLQQAIVDLILPRYMRLDRRDRLRTRVTVLSVALAASSAIMPYPVNTIVGIVMGLPLVYAGARLFALNTEDTVRAFKVLRIYFHLLYLAVAFIVTTIGLVFILYPPQTSGGYFWKIVTGGGLLLLGLYAVLRKLIDKCVKQICSTDPVLKLG